MLESMAANGSVSEKNSEGRDYTASGFVQHFLA
jgi:hypothetical protein